MAKLKVGEEEWMHFRENYEGFCKDCNEFTRSCTEPDAVGYDCPDCGKESVYGSEEALFRDMIELVERG